MSHSTLSRWLLGSATILALVFAAWLAHRHGASLAETIEAARRLPSSLLVAVFGLSLANYLLRFRRWEILLGPVAGTLGRIRHLLVYLAGFSLTLTPAKAGEALRTLYLLPYGVPAARSLASLAVERVLDVMAVAVLACLVVNLWPPGWAIVVPSLAAAAVLLGLIARIGDPGTSKLFPAWFPVKATNFMQWVRLSLHSLGPQTIGRGVLLSLAGWGMEAIGLVLLSKYFSPDISAWAVAGIFGASVLAGALTFLPGGLGGTELVMVALLATAGLSGSEAAAATAVCRLATLWFGFFLGLLALPAIAATKKKSVG